MAVLKISALAVLSFVMQLCLFSAIPDDWSRFAVIIAAMSVGAVWGSIYNAVMYGSNT